MFYSDTKLYDRSNSFGVATSKFNVQSYLIISFDNYRMRFCHGRRFGDTIIKSTNANPIRRWPQVFCINSKHEWSHGDLQPRPSLCHSMLPQVQHPFISTHILGNPCLKRSQKTRYVQIYTPSPSINEE
jgi:hypothetical protein